MAASSLTPARNNSLFLAGWPIELKRAFSNVSCAYSSLGMVKLSRSILIFSGLSFLGGFLADFFARAAFGFTTAVFAGIAVLATTLFAAGLAADLDDLGFAPGFGAVGFTVAGLTAVGASFVVLGVVVSDMELS